MIWLTPDELTRRRCRGSCPLGAAPAASDGTTLFRVWAPRPRAVEVERRRARASRSAPRAAASSRARRRPRPGDDYRYLLDGGDPLPDPARASSPRACAGRRGSSTPARSRGPTTPGPASTAAALVIYELHVGTFTPEGTFAAAAGRLAELRELGVTAIELMPVATFPGARNWGYDGVYTWAPHPAYGGPEGLRRWSTPPTRAGSG